MTKAERLDLLQYTSNQFSMKTQQDGPDSYTINVYNKWNELVDRVAVDDTDSDLKQLDKEFDRLRDEYIFDYDNKLVAPLSSNDQQKE